MVQTKVILVIKDRDEEVKTIDEENKKRWQAAVDEELKKKCDELLLPTFDKNKSRKGSWKDVKKSTIKVGSKPLYSKTEAGKPKKAAQTPVFKKDDIKKSFK